MVTDRGCEVCEGGGGGGGGWRGGCWEETGKTGLPSVCVCVCVVEQFITDWLMEYRWFEGSSPSSPP